MGRLAVHRGDALTVWAWLVGIALALVLGALFAGGAAWAGARTGQCEQIGQEIGAPSGWTPWGGCTVILFGQEWRAF